MAERARFVVSSTVDFSLLIGLGQKLLLGLLLLFPFTKITIFDAQFLCLVIKIYNMHIFF